MRLLEQVTDLGIEIKFSLLKHIHIKHINMYKYIYIYIYINFILFLNNYVLRN